MKNLRSKKKPPCMTRWKKKDRYFLQSHLFYDLLSMLMLLTMKINLFSFTIPILQHPLCLYHKISTFLLQCNSKLAWVAGIWKQWPKERTGARQLFFLVPTTSKCLLCRLTPSYFVGTWQYIPNCFNCSKSLYFYNERLWGNAGLCGAFEKYNTGNVHKNRMHGWVALPFTPQATSDKKSIWTFLFLLKYLKYFDV